MDHRVFVYGSLRRGFVHHAELVGARFVAEARTADGYELVQVGEYPALVVGDSTAPDGVLVSSRVRGELYLVDDALLDRLDAFEQAPELYRRAEIVLDDGTVAWGYVMPRAAVSGCPRVPGGCWVEPDQSAP